MSKNYYVYILTNFDETSFYIGVTNDILRRIYEHKNKLFKGHSQKYNLVKLVYYEITSSIEEAILREKKLKNWHKEWKINLIKKSNPEFKDLYEDLFEE
jgi:putative endonuclease